MSSDFGVSVLVCTVPNLLDAPMHETESASLEQAMDAMNEAVREAQERLAAARRFLTIFTYGYRTPACFDSRRHDLIAVGVPERHLPPLGRSWSAGVDWPESSALCGAFGELAGPSALA